VIEWTTKGFYERRRVALGELPGDLPEVGSPIDDADTRYDLERALESLSEGGAEVARLRFLEGLEIDEIAERLGKTRNAVDQALHRSRKKLQELLR
jgi:RNA polymerase sigma factor (sigma-70 family)